MKVFLGGTVNGSTWRDYMMPKLEIEFFNPVVPIWNDEAYEKEMFEKRHADYNLYVITPRLTGFFGIAEAMDDAFQKPDKTIFCFLTEDGGRKFTPQEIQTLHSLGEKIRGCGAVWLDGLDETIEYLNSSITSKTDNNWTSQFDAYITHDRSHSKKLATSIKESFSNQKLTAVCDLNDTPPPIQELTKIKQSIASCRNFIFIVTNKSIQSEYCLRDLEYAISLNKEIVPILHEQPTGNWSNWQTKLAAFGWHLYNEENPTALIHALQKSCSENLIAKTTYTSALLNALHWKKEKENLENLLQGEVRRSTGKWFNNLSKQEKDNLPLLVNNFIETSLNQEPLIRLLNRLSKRFKTVLQHRNFEKWVTMVSLANPISMLPQLIIIIQNKLSGTPSGGVSISMFSIFLVINVFFLLTWIKQKNKGMFVSTLLSILIIISIIIISVFS